MTPATTRISADERRDVVIKAATTEFAATGYAGTSAESIARRAGVSQPYLFQLFGTKRDLFLAAVRACFGRCRGVFEQTGAAARAQNPDPCYVLDAMGHAYKRLLVNREQLRLQLQAYAACEDHEIQEVVRDEFAGLYRSVARVSGASDEQLKSWFAQGMLLNVSAAIGGGPIDHLDMEDFESAR
jgi:AcrR family transcriptional regulator